MKETCVLYLVIITLIFTACEKKEKPMYEGKNINNEAVIRRDKKAKSTTVEINTNGIWKIYAGNSAKTIDFSNPILTGEENGVFGLEVSDSSRVYFYIETHEGKGVMAERHLPMDGGYNFRDLGGFQTTDGKYVKWGKIFRSDELAFLTDKDLKYLASIPLRTIVDFRSIAEVEQAPDKLPESVKNYYNLNIEIGNVFQQNKDADWSKIDFTQIMLQMNRLLVTDEETIEKYKKFFELVQSKDNEPLIYHCSAGKDRTGMATALILYSLGVDQETIMSDYVASVEYLADKYAMYIEKYPTMQPLMIVKPEYLQAGFDEIENTYGSVENYLTDILKVDIKKMKDLYLY